MERLVISSYALPCNAAAANLSTPVLASNTVDGASSRNVRPASAIQRHHSPMPRVPANRTPGRSLGDVRVFAGQLSAARFVSSSLHSNSSRRVHCNASAGSADGTGSSDDKGEEEEGGEAGGNGEQGKTDKRADDAVPSERKDKSEEAISEDLVSEDENADIVSSLGDWREFRARLIRGEVGVAGEEPGASGSTDGGDALTGSTSTAGDLPGLEDVAEAGAGASAAAGGGAGGAAEGDERRGTVPSPLSPSSSPSSSSSLPKSWAHPIAVPETGCVLLAHPKAFGVSQQYFNRAVIFLLMHGPQGTAGVILNRPSQYTLGQLAGFEELMPEFSACPLYLGGDVGSTSTHCLHGVADLVGGEGGAREVCPGVYVGGYSRIKEHVGSGKSNSMDYRWFARYAGWAPGQLEREVAAGVWYLGACSPDLILRHSLRESDTVESNSDSSSSEIDNIEAAGADPQSSSSTAGGEGGGRRGGGVGVSGNTVLWREVMELMGGDFALLCKQADGEL
ncbi:hypothetical protein CLOM_g13832 [Closterium sp. NIES-68]|nr:hypothetical protein CLOM_g13832 [Closterium sp. NIES-68]GJP81512.1 hypothetical protein CLOP_g11656 [Closterium sp. NIES-67]